MEKIKNTERGSAGEALAEAFLQQRNIKVLCKNYRSGHAEIDIVAMDEKELIIVEVKIRQSNKFGFPEESVTKRKEELLKKAGYSYKFEHQIELPVRFDVIAISIEEQEIKHFKEAF